MRRKLRRLVKRFLRIKSPSEHLHEQWYGKEKNHGEPIGTVTEQEETDEGLRIGVRTERTAEEVLKEMIRGNPNRITFWSNNAVVESMTLNEQRTLQGYEALKELIAQPAERKRCEYCGCVAEKETGTCAHCGAPL